MTDNKKILPKLRFPEFENDGEWKVVKFKDIFTMLSNNTLSRAELSEQDGIALNIHYGDVLIKFGERLDLNNDNLSHIKDDEILHKYKSSYLKDGDVIFADTAEDETAGKCTEIRNIGKQIVISGLHTIPCRPKNEFAPYYLGYYLNSNAYHTKLLPLMQGAKVTSISRSSLQETTVVYPPSLPEQQKIAAFLTSLDEQISAHTKKLEALKAHKKGLMQQLFPANGEKTPKLRFPEFKNAGEWKEVRLGEISDVYSGGTPNVGIPDYYNGSIPFIRSGKIKESHTKLFISQNGLVNSSAKMVAKGDILYALYGATSGEVAISQIDGAINQAILAIIPHNSIDKYLICQILAHKKPDITNRYLQGGQGNLSAQIIKSVTMSIPKYEEQQKIASFLLSIDEMIHAQDDKIRKLKTYKNGLMQQMFAVETPYYDVSTDDGKLTMTPYYDVSTDDGKLTMTPYYDVSTGNN